jgi:RimJ/RimL family protein N-acetyltransferase
LGDSKVIGHVGLYNIDFRVRKAEFAILIAGEDNQGKGYGSLCTKFMIDYAFDELNIRKINLSLLSENKRAVSMYNKIGFLQEGILRNDQYKNGKYHDVILMALARSY